MSKMLSKMTLISTVQQLPSEDIETIQGYVEMIENENEELKKQLEEKEKIACNWKDSCLENAGKIEKAENQQQEFIKYLEDEKDRLARGISSSYEDYLGKTRFVNEDIFNEIDKNLQKYKSIIGVQNGKQSD